MSTNVSGLELFVPVKEPPRQQSVDQWAESFKLNTGRIIEKLRAKIPDLKAYLENLANPAGRGWKDVINPAFKSKSGADAASLKDKHQSNLNRTYNKFDTALAHIFETIDEEVGKRFKEIIDNKKDLFAEGMADRTLRFTGDKIRGRGITPLAAMWLSGDITVADLLRPGDKILYGGPVDVSKPGLRPQLRAGLVSRLMQSGMAIVYSEYSPTRIATENTLINSFLSALRDNTVYEEFVEPLTPLKSHCGYYMESGQLFLRIQVVAL
ncbi:MAG: hypothetical protein HY762_01480 [Planctomycetes bacterium]|nr:hypothetical protein [Planctomycetota bacterium]